MRVIFANDTDMVADNLQFWFEIKRLSLCRDHIARYCLIPVEMSEIRHLYCKRFMQNISVFNPLLFMSLYVKLMKGKALRKHSLHEKTAASKPNNATIVSILLKNNPFYLIQYILRN